MNAIEFLKNDHKKVRKILVQIANKSREFETRKNLFIQLAKDLIRHEKIEHKIWYPHFKEDLPDAVKHLIKEENKAEKEIENLKKLNHESSWNTEFIKFKKNVEHHASEEEEKLFPEVQKLLSSEQLKKIGEEMISCKVN